MSGVFWFRFTYPTCPENINERQKIRKYQILQYNRSTQNGKLTKLQKYKNAVSNTRNITRKTNQCTGFNPPTCSDVPGFTWDLFVTKKIINHKDILNNKHVIPKSGASSWKYSTEHIDTS
jgi:hypothetical protein